MGAVRGRVERGRAALVLLALVLVLSGSARAEVAPYFRLFLQDGTVVTCLGEYARVGERVVFTMPIGAESQAELASLPVSAVDWTKTDRYTESLRATRYADSRGEGDFADLAGDVARVLNEIALSGDAPRRLQLALEARRRLDAWPREHYGYRAADVAQIVELVDQAISEFRASAGEDRFDLTFVATPEAPAAVALLDVPSTEEFLTSAAGRCPACRRPGRAADAVRVARPGHRRGGLRARRPRQLATAGARPLAPSCGAYRRDGLCQSRHVGGANGRTERKSR